MAPAEAAAEASAAPTLAVEVMAFLVHRYLDFRRPEIDSIVEYLGLDGQVSWRLPDGGCEDSPFWRLRLPCLADAARIASRSLLCKVMLDVWGEGETLAACVEAILAHPGASPPRRSRRCPLAALSPPLPRAEHLRAPFLCAESSFKVVVDGFGVRRSMAEQREVLDGMLAVPFLGRVSLDNPDHTFWIVEAVGPRENSTLPPVTPRWYFGREVGRGDRSILPPLDLKQRRYLGPTSMDHEMALLMCTQGMAGPGRLIHDPFCGTGSVLMAAASAGALTMGGDIDVRVLRDGKVHKPSGGARVNNWTNFRDARLPLPLALLHCDLAAMPLRRDLTGWAHGWVCDPPYGVRAGGRKSGGRKRDENGEAFPVPEEHRDSHVPSTAFYPLSECLADLLEEAARALTLRGRLVYFYPALCGVPFEPLSLPQHPCLELVCTSMQPLSMRWGRRLVTMRKTREWDAACRAQAHVQQGPMRAALDAMRLVILEKGSSAELEAEMAQAGLHHPNGEKIYRNKRC